MTKTSKMVTSSILSMSLLTVMAGAAIAPALSIIKEHFNDSSAMAVRLIVSMPALFIILTNLCFMKISRWLTSREIAIIGLSLYVVAGSGCFFVDDIRMLLLMRALLGISVGLIMPLSTGLLSLYYPPEQQARLMGLSAAMNQMGGVVATLLAGLLAAVEWRYSFLVYLCGLIALIMVYLWLPDERLRSENKRGKSFESRQLLKFHPSVVGMFLLMVVFFVFPTNFAVIARQNTHLSVQEITIIMVGLDFIAFLAGIYFGRLMSVFRKEMKYFSPVLFLVGYVCYLNSNVMFLILGSVCIGIANGIGVPYLLTIASIKGGKNSATTVMPLLSIALYLGQFLSPFIAEIVNYLFFQSEDVTAAYKTAIVLSAIFFFQVWATRKYQSLPPAGKQ